MDKKHVYVIEGNPNTGKTLTAWLIYLYLKNEKNFSSSSFALLSQGNKDVKTLMGEISYLSLPKESPCDFKALLKSGSNTIAIFSAGDTDECIAEAFRWMKTNNANVLVCTSRSNGNSYARQELENHVKDNVFSYFRVFKDVAGFRLEEVANAREPMAQSIANQILSDIIPNTQDGEVSPLYIKSIYVKGLWDEYNIRWDLNREVNILTGHCGSGKSTVLCLLYSLLRYGELRHGLLEKVTQVEIEFSDGSLLVNDSFYDTIEKLREKASENKYYYRMFKEIERHLDESITFDNVKNLRISNSVSNVQKDNEDVLLVDFLKEIHVDIIRTFDIPYALTDKYKDLGKDENKNDTELDRLLRIVNEKFAYYIGKLAANIEQYSTQKAVPQDFITRTYSSKNAFVSMLDRYLNETGKRVNIDGGKLHFEIIHNHKIISLKELSSGEKQLIYILTKVLVEEQQPYLLLMDEPELSLHVSWQKDLIKNIRVLNPNCQLVLVTHSPSMLSEGYYSYVTFIDDIRKSKD